MPSPGDAEPGKQRHGCLTAWLIAMIVMSSFAVLVYVLAMGFLLEMLPGASAWAVYTLAALAVLNLGFAIALWRWKKWGLWGYGASSLAAFWINLSIGTGLGPSLMGLLGLAILFAALQIGRENRGWPQLD